MDANAIVIKQVITLMKLDLKIGRYIVLVPAIESIAKPETSCLVGLVVLWSTRRECIGCAVNQGRISVHANARERINGAFDKWLSHWLFTPVITGSNPVRPTTYKIFGTWDHFHSQKGIKRNDSHGV